MHFPAFVHSRMMKTLSTSLRTESCSMMYAWPWGGRFCWQRECTSQNHFSDCIPGAGLRFKPGFFTNKNKDSISLFFICLFICLFIYLSVCSFVCLFVYFFIYLFVCLFVCLEEVFGPGLNRSSDCSVRAKE